MADIPVVAAAIDTFAAANLGTDITLYEPDTADTMTIANSGKSFYLIVNNLEAVEDAIVTFTCPGTTTDLSVPVDDYAVTIAAGEMRQLGPFVPTLTFNTGANVVCTFTGSFSSAGVQVSCVAVP